MEKIKKCCKYFASACFTLVLCIVLLPSNAKASTVASGTCGDNLTWTLDNAGTLTISGTGEMMSAPWDSNCSSVRTVLIEYGVTNIRDSAFNGCYNLTRITIPDSVTYLGQRAFAYCTNLKNIDIPVSVCSIGHDLCERSGLTDIYYYGTAAQWNAISIGSQNQELFYATRHYCVGSCGTNLNYRYEPEIATLTISGTGPMSDYTSGSAPWYSDHSLIESVVIGDGVTRIGDYAFYDCTALTSAPLPKSVTSIGTWAFTGCVGLSVTIPDDVTSIGDYAFYGTDLTTVTIPNGVTGIGFYTFSNCTGLTNITIPNSTTSIESYAFRNCTSLTDIYFTGTQDEWDAITIASGNDSLTSATLHVNYVSPPDFTLASINLGESISFKFYVPLTAAQLEHAIRVDFDMDVADGTDKTQSVALAGATYDGGTDSYVFTYTGVTPQCINDDVTAELYMDGVKVDTVTMSVADYLKLHADTYDTADALIGALAVYGDAARAYTDYRAAETSIATVIGQSTATAAKPAAGRAKPQSVSAAAGELEFAGTRLVYSNVPTIMIKVNAAADGAYIKCGDVKVADVTVGTNEYRVMNLTATGINVNYTFALYDSSDNLVQTLTYGVPACAYGWWDLGTKPAYTALVKALYTYGVEAAAYVGGGGLGSGEFGGEADPF